MSMMCFLSFDLSPTRVVEGLREKYTHLARRVGSLRGLVFPQRRSATIRTPLVSKYAPQGRLPRAISQAFRSCPQASMSLLPFFHRTTKRTWLMQRRHSQGALPYPRSKTWRTLRPHCSAALLTTPPCPSLCCPLPPFAHLTHP